PACGARLFCNASTFTCIMTSPAPSSAGPSPRLILASASPRRQTILRDAGYDFVVHPANINEETFSLGQLPSEVAQHLALAKADAVSALYPDDVVLGADTIVAFGDRVLGKPKDASDAQRMLDLLSGTTQIVITGIAV